MQKMQATCAANNDVSWSDATPSFAALRRYSRIVCWFFRLGGRVGRRFRNRRHFQSKQSSAHAPPDLLLEPRAHRARRAGTGRGGTLL